MFMRLFKNKLIWAVIPACLLVQLVYLCIIVPAFNHMDENTSNIRIAIVNDDNGDSGEIVSKLKEELPFNTCEERNLSNAMAKMSAREYGAVFFFNAAFTQDLEDGNASITYYINQAAPSMLKQILDTAVDKISSTINENAFSTIKSKIQDGIEENFSGIKLPASALDGLKSNIDEGISQMREAALDAMGKQLANFKLPSTARNALKTNVGNAMDMVKANFLKGLLAQMKGFKLPDAAIGAMKQNLANGFSGLKANILAMVDQQLKTAGLPDADIAATKANIGGGLDAFAANAVSGMAAQMANFSLPDEAIAAMGENVGGGLDMIKSKVMSAFQGSLSKFKLPSSASAMMKDTISDGFATLKETALSAIDEKFENFQMPDEAADTIRENLNKAFDVLQYTTIQSNVVKLNDSEEYILTIAPFFLFLILFIASSAYTVLHLRVFQGLGKEIPPWPIYLYRLAVDVIASLVMPLAFFTILWSFGIAISASQMTLWLLISAGFLALVQLLQVFADLFGLKGLIPMILVLMPLQMATNGTMFPQEMLPPFFSAVGGYLPASYFGSGLIKSFFGGAPAGDDILILLAMAGACLCITAACAAIRDIRRRHSKQIQESR